MHSTLHILAISQIMLDQFCVFQCNTSKCVIWRQIAFPYTIRTKTTNVCAGEMHIVYRYILVR